MTEYIYETLGKPMLDEDGLISVPRERIVRCKDCALFVPEGTYHFNSGVANKATCHVIRGFYVQIDHDGFCAWGEVD